MEEVYIKRNVHCSKLIPFSSKPHHPKQKKQYSNIHFRPVAHTPEPKVIKEFHPLTPKKKKLEKGLRSGRAAAKSTCPSYKLFPPTSCFVYRIDNKSPVFRDGTL
jgi:hypothetical protein